MLKWIYKGERSVKQKRTEKGVEREDSKKEEERTEEEKAE